MRVRVLNFLPSNQLLFLKEGALGRKWLARRNELLILGFPVLLKKDLSFNYAMLIVA
jgi:hypothetical protein